MKSQCKTCGKNCEGEYCFQHKPRKPLTANKRITSRNLTNNVKKDKVIRDISEMQEFFLKIWKKKPHYSEISGKYLGKEPLTVFFHHILPKNKYLKAAFDEENIILLTLEEHEQVEMDIYRYEEINLKRDQLKNKYQIL